MSENAPDAPAEDNGGNGGGNGSGRVLNANRRRPLLTGLAIAVVVVGLLAWLYITFIGSRSVSTDNAYVAGENAEITPLTSGSVIEVAVTDTQQVKRGQVLLRLEDADQRIAVAQAEAMLALTQRRYRQSLAQGSALGASADAKDAALPAAQARLASAQADLIKAQTDYRRRAALVDGGAVSADEVTAARNALTAAQAAVQAAQAGIGQARADAISARRDETAAMALVSGTTTDTAPEVRAAQARLAQAKLDLSRTVIRAPIDGVVARRSVQVGQKIEAGNVAMVIVPVGQLYVDANFKEDQLGKVKPGQRAVLTSDFYGSGVEFHGRVVGFAGGTGAAFALIPAQNATGNWIKVVQRLPVRIALDPRELARHPLRVGLSMDAEIDLTDND
ncbi:HlyD family efflux transporter periplasmic adaptor subunit [Novosphingobium album (ex Liu et al. 2023)]|uniref:HlyD family efflux transporter periplasmic adaptor subunit n=1 Tax=Novosphingobium album (ex Liu et al. 2023) TaxID=3031130 RepID=A0ABT5WX56_9SPHN|nr:HlyD family efflux transporter periplasmic adaptor subunit [Novosphingobium album (ex Liu et al. 2023)]MDE8654434.1 HlyD family efflux transporter periplasmic adaptor subunit [Novosphingobium album (ex Liu et al. 2023)]